MKSEKISELTTNRLSVYLRCLNLLASAGIKTISSQALADQFNLNSAQIRKDLAHFGEFGTRGVGYSVDELRRHLTQILGLDSAHRVGIVGAGNLGTALANYNGFRASNFEVVALFDNDREKIGRRVGEAQTAVHDVRKLARVVRDEAIDVAVIAVPARVAQRVLNQVMSRGRQGRLEFRARPTARAARRQGQDRGLDDLAGIAIVLSRAPADHLRHQPAQHPPLRGDRAARRAGVTAG